MKSKRVVVIPVKSLAQQNLTHIHRSRSLVMKRRTQLTNHIRSQLAELGLICTQGFSPLKKLVSEVLAGEKLELCSDTLFVFQDLYSEWQQLNQRLKEYDKLIQRVAKDNPYTQRLMQLPGVAKITATAILAKVDSFERFNKGSAFGAWIGLTPKENSSANRKRLGKISKQGDRYLRTLMIQGAHSSIQSILLKDKQETAYHRWVQKTVNRIGKQKTAVALANKHARMIWAIMKHGRTVDLNHAESFAA